MIGEGQASRHQGMNDVKSGSSHKSDAAYISQGRETCPIQACSKAFGVPFSISKLVAHLHEKHHNVELPAVAVNRYGLARCELCNKYVREKEV